ncbi:HAD family hydrolase [Gymnodinialimonas sp. 2305UL16-5]|uniref:HAD family hydrolase n=1 Tax=Gymnodinialimonas mytili TaxID=3126503 RepID=UPI00309AC639
MGKALCTIGFDADDTLWHNQAFFKLAEDRFVDLLSDHGEDDALRAQLLDIKKRNIGHYGFGVKGFTLSMIETAVALSDGPVDGRILARILEMGQEMLRHPVELLPHVESVLGKLSATYPLILITKGDLRHQEQKLAASGLGELFTGVQIVSDKTPETYRDAFHEAGPDRAMMVGNSMKSDVIPALQAGAWGVYVPHGESWAMEQASTPKHHPRYHEIVDLGALPDCVDRVTQGA